MIETEEAVICGLLLNRNRLVEVAGWLTAEMFEGEAAGFVYAALLAQFNRGEEPDLVTTEAEMLRMDAARHASIGGLAFLARGMTRVRHDANLLRYAAEVKRRFLLRRLKALADGMGLEASAPGTDPMALVARTEQALLGLREMHLLHAGAMRTLPEVATDVLAYHRAQQQGGKVRGYVLTGFDEFDRLTGGMHPGELFVGAGRPGDGKSAVAIQIALNAALAGRQVSFFSLEMTERQIMDRLYAGHAGVEAARLRVSRLHSGELEEMQKLADRWKELPLSLDYMAVNSVENIRAQVMLERKRKGCHLVVVDYLHMLAATPGRGETLEQVIARHVRALKALAKEADCPVLALSQMNRASETRSDKSHVPILSDLRDSGTIEQVADCVFFVYRPERHGITKDERTGESLAGVGKLIIAKHRNGATGVARFRHNPTFTKLSNYDAQLSAFGAGAEGAIEN